MSTISITEASRQLSQLINRAAYGRDIVILTSRGQAKAVLLGMEAFDALVGMRACAERPLMPLDQFQQKFHAALAAAGYGAREQIIELVREVKQERALEKRQQARGHDSEINR